MARGVKTDNAKIAEIITSYTLTNSYNKTAKEVGVSANTVKNVINRQKTENAEEFAKICEEKKELFQDKANKIIDKALDLLDRRFDKALNNELELQELIDEVLAADEEKYDIRYQEKIAIAKKIGRIQLNSLSEITTSMGTLYDKMRLAKGEATENQSITIKMSDNIKELSK